MNGYLNEYMTDEEMRRQNTELNNQMMKKRKYVKQIRVKVNETKLRIINMQ